MSPARSRPAGAVVLAALLAAGLACQTVLGPRPPVAWDPDPQALVLSATFCCGLAPSWVTENYIPEVQIWGDGRIVWVERNQAGGQRVLTGVLTPDQLAALLQQYVDAGFFGWDSLYGDFEITDGASQCVRVALASVSKEVCEYYSGAPEAFRRLYSVAASGAGAAGEAFVPTQGYVIADRQNYSMPPTGDDYLLWPAESLGVSLDDLWDGAWLEGAPLAFAWRVVAGDTWQPLVRQGEAYYLLTVRVPGISQMDPPTPPPDPE